MLNGLNFQVWVEFLDGTAGLIRVPVWLKDTGRLITVRPGTSEEVSVHYARVSNAGIPIYRENPVAEVFCFQTRKLLKSPVN